MRIPTRMSSSLLGLLGYVKRESDLMEKVEGHLSLICSSSSFRVGAIVLAIVLGCELHAVQADTMSYADAVTALADKCGSDIKRHCPGVSLANNQVQACLTQHQASVSPTCTATLAEVVSSISVRQAAQLSYFKVCAGDAARHCKGVKGEANILGCLIKTTHIDGAKCNQAITDAGWR